MFYHLELVTISTAKIKRKKIEIESTIGLAKDAIKYLNRINRRMFEDIEVTNKTHIIKEYNKFLTKRALMMSDQNKIKSLTSEIAFFIGLFKDDTFVGFPHMWDGNGDLYSKVEYLEKLKKKSNEEKYFGDLSEPLNGNFVVDKLKE